MNLLCRIAVIFNLCFLASVLPVLGQTPTQVPAPTGQLNDFAGVVDKETKDRIEATLRNIKEKTKVNFLVATVDSTGAQDISPFSRQLARDWNIILSYKTEKTILLVISVASKTSIAQMSRGAQTEFPDGILGELAYRMRTPLEAGKFTEAVETGVQFFLSALAKKTGVSVDELNSTVAAAPTSSSETGPPVEQTSSQSTRPRVVSEPAKPEASPEVVIEEPVKQEPAKQEPSPEVAKNEKPPKSSSSNASTKKPSDTKTPVKTPRKNTPEDDADESEEVELTLTLPLARRAEALKKFLETYPESKSKVRAQELLLSTRAGLADNQMKEGNTAVGVEQLLALIDEADASVSDKAYSGVIAQIPTNLYMRGERASAFQAASNIEARFGSNPQRLLPIAAFYLGIERADDALRIAESAVKLAPDLAEAHRTLALAMHINLRLDDAAAEYKRTLELDPKSRVSRGSLADLLRANGKPEEALSLYEEQLKVDPKDKAAKAGQVIALLDLGKKDEATSALEAALAAEPRNLPLLTGASYWYAAHQNYQKAFELARSAVGIEPRYTWAQIAMVRALVGLKQTLDAERAMRYARQFGKFPTLDYELANVLAATGLYDEAIEVLRESFWIREDEIETKLAGRLFTRKGDFLELLAPERKASIFQPTAGDTPVEAKMMKGLLSLDFALAPEKPDETLSLRAVQDFIGGNDSMRTYRQLYAATRLIRSGVAYPTALELLEEARKSADVALNLPTATVAVQAEEYRQLRARAIAAGSVPAVESAPPSVLANIFKGRVEDLTGWAMFNQEKYSEALPRLKRASDILPAGTPAWRNALWHLGAALEQTGQNREALESYIKSYNGGPKEPVRRSVIENLYKKVNGSINGLDDRIGEVLPTSPTTPVNTPAESTQPATTEPSATSEQPTTQPVTTEPPKTETVTTPTPESTTSSAMTQDEAFKSASSSKPLRVKISGRILDADRNPMGNVVIVLISPLGSVISATTDSEGNYSFTVSPSQKSYRLIPSKEGFSFSPIDKSFAMLLESQKDVDFTASRTP